MKHFWFAALAALLIPVGEGSGQDKTPTKPPPVQPKVRPQDVPGYKIQVIEGFTVLLSDETVKMQDTVTYERKPLEVLELELKIITKLLPARAVNILRGVLIWVEWDERVELSSGREGTATAIYYGGHQRGMLQKGKHPLKAKNVTILRMKSLTEEHQPKTDRGRCVILHEIAHAVHDQLLSNNNPQVKAAYKQAMERKLYDLKMYASTNENEFFAELTCAYFDQLHYYPRTRADLQKHDPVTYQLMEAVWGKRKDDVTSKPGSEGSVDPNLRLEKYDLGKPVLGPKVSPGDLKGRPVMVVLWNASSTSSLACFQKVNAWDAELSDFGLTSVALHLTGTRTHDVPGVAQSRGIPFAVTEARWVPARQIDDIKDFPQCLVFDHTGQCVFRGSAFDAESAVRGAVGSALVAGTDIETFPQALAAVVESLRKGKPPAAVLPQLVPHIRSGDAETVEAAKRLAAKITEGGRKALQEAEALVKEDPVAAYLKLERLPILYKDSSVGARANELLGKLKQDKAVAAELRARPALAVVKKLDTELGGRPGSFDPKLEKFRKDNALALKQLGDAVALMKKSWPGTRATQEALRIAEKYSVTVQ